MTAPIFHWFGKSQKQGPVANKFGELALPFAPLVTLDSGERVVPQQYLDCLLYTSPSPRDKRQSRMPSSA